MMSLEKRSLLLTSVPYAVDVFQLKDAMLRRLFSFRGRAKEGETVAIPTDEPAPQSPGHVENASSAHGPPKKNAPQEVNQEQAVTDVEKLSRELEPQPINDLEAQKDSEEENEVNSRSHGVKDENERADINEKNNGSRRTPEKKDESHSVITTRVEKDEDRPDGGGGANEDREDSGIEGDPGSTCSSSDSDSPTKCNALTETNPKLDPREKEKFIENELAHLSPIHLRRILERKHRRQDVAKECCKHCESTLPPKHSASPVRKMYRSPDKKRRELAMRPPWQSSYSNRPPLRWDPFSGGPERKRYPFNRGLHSGLYRGPIGWSSPMKKGILKPPNTVKKVIQKKRQLAAGKERNRKRADSETSDSNSSSGDELKHMPVRKIFSNQSALRKRIDDLEDMLRGMQEQREQLEAVLGVLEEWAQELRNVDRTKLGVPYIRDVKQVLSKHRQVLNNKKSNLQKTLSSLAEIPYCNELHDLMEQLSKEVTAIVRDQRKFSAKTVENVRQIQGRLIGTCNAILVVYYDE